ncbi:dienelactone hydrolase family protein [Demequina sp. SO4-13]|uniref:dienelactone hydrolase family protein n=1 Tax=Demequina sp. SO4-13 TaxID=3401027 RepID=UPI003AF70742
MASVILLHSALGLTQPVVDWAESLRADGHLVVTPDMFGGRTFHDLDEGTAFAESEGGPPALVDAVLAQAAGLEGPRVYAGFSLGAAVAELLALTRPDAGGLVLMHGAVSPAWFGVDSWPAGLRAQLHYAVEDPRGEPEENAAFLALAGASCETFVYGADGHLFAFEDWREHDGEAAHRMHEHVGDFLSSLD